MLVANKLSKLSYWSFSIQILLKYMKIYEFLNDQNTKRVNVISKLKIKKFSFKIYLLKLLHKFFSSTLNKNPHLKYWTMK